MATNRWDDVDYPLLVALAEAAEREPLKPLLSARAAAEAAGLGHLTEDQVIASLKHLKDGGYLEATFYRSSGRTSVVTLPGLTAMGLRAVRAWPSDDPFEAFVQVIEQRMQSEADPEVKTRLQRALAAFRDVGTQVGSQLVVNLASRAAGGW